MQNNQTELLSQFLNELPEYMKELDQTNNSIVMLNCGKKLEQKFINIKDIDSQVAMHCYSNALLQLFASWLEDKT